MENENLKLLHGHKSKPFFKISEKQYYEGGAHFSYKQLYNKLLDLAKSLSPSRVDLDESQITENKNNIKIKIDKFSKYCFRNISNINSLNYVKMVYSNTKDKSNNDKKSVDTIGSIQCFKTEEFVDRLKLIKIKREDNKVNSNCYLYSGGNINNRSLAKSYLFFTNHNEKKKNDNLYNINSIGFNINSMDNLKTRNDKILYVSKHPSISNEVFIELPKKIKDFLSHGNIMNTFSKPKERLNSKPNLKSISSIKILPEKRKLLEHNIFFDLKKKINRNKKLSA